MARIQVLHLPGGADDYPFALVIDGWTGSPESLSELHGVKDEIGASAVLVFEEEVEVT